VDGFASEDDHNTCKTGEPNRDLRRRAESFTRFHSYLNSAVHGEL